MHPGNQEVVQNPTFPRLEGCGRGLLRWEGPERHPGSLREDDGGGGANELKAVLSGAGGRGSKRGGEGCTGLQSFNDPGSSLVKVCQRSIFLSLFLRQSNQCLSRSPFALMPRDTPPGGRARHQQKHHGNEGRAWTLTTSHVCLKAESMQHERKRC